MKIIEKVAEGYRLPGLVDAHVHVESSHLRPGEFGRAIALQGTFYAICDPHEIVNVAGEAGLEFMLQDARESLARLYFTLPSCVPATEFETSGAKIDAAETARLFARHPELVALGEMMNYPGVIAGDPDVMGKIRAAKALGKRVDGHFPGGRGKDLKIYAAAGISSDHESENAKEALEKIANGMMAFIREGSSAKNLESVLPAVNKDNYERFAFCTDDLSAADIASGKGILDCVRKSVSLGLDAEMAVAMASLNPARHYGLKLDEEAYVIVRDLKDFEIVRINPPRKQENPNEVQSSASLLSNSVKLPLLKDFSCPDFEREEGGILAIGVSGTSLITEKVLLQKGQAYSKMAVIERHGINGNIAYAPVVGAGNIKGALATTIGHDSHNLLVLGDSDCDMRLAAERLQETGGGAAVVSAGKILAEFHLPIGGLMSSLKAEDVAREDAALKKAAQSIGFALPEPLTTMSFLALPVIGRIRLTDRGLFDVDAWKFV